MKGSVKLPVFIDDARKLVNTTQLRAKYLGATYEAEYCQWQALHGLGSLMETASLIITPNAYLEGKLLASYPPDPIGDFDVTRATTATRVNSAGLVELVPYNLVQYSEDLTNAIWTPLNEVTITANASIAPNGTTTADRLQGTGSSWFFAQQKALTSGVSHTISAYVKSNTGSSQTFRLFGCGSLVSSDFTATTQWQRFEFTFTSTTDITHGIARNSSNATADLLVWGAQINEGTLKPYQKTETRLNIPRLDYSNGTCPSLLVEPQRTNLITYSSSLDNAAYTKAQYGTGTISVTANYGLAPDGTMTADRVQMTQGNFASELFQRPSTTAGQTYTVSFWAKSLSGTPTLYTLFDNSLYQNPITFISEWVRYEYTYTAVFATSGFNLITFTGLSGTSASADILVWGVQHEQGSYATSYIPTTSASVTRNADVISKTGISSLIGQTEGVIFYDFILSTTGVDFTLGNLYSSSNANSYSLFYINPSNQVGVSLINNGVTQCEFVVPTLSLGRHRIAFAYKANDFAVYVDGVQIGTDTSGSVPNMDEFNLSGFNLAPSAYRQEVNIYAAALWKTRKTNTQLAQLTTI